MKRIICEIPRGLEIEQLTDEQQLAIASVFAQFVNPMPGAKVLDDTQLVDGVVGDNFLPEAIAELGMTDWKIVGLWYWDGVQGNPYEELLPLDVETLLEHLHDEYIYSPITGEVIVDEDGNAEMVTPKRLRIPHGFAGHPIPDISEYLSTDQDDNE